MAKKKQEALTVTRLINEVLVNQLSIPLRQIVNDISFAKYTGSKRPDLLISEFEYTGENDEQFIKNLVAYAEVKDKCSLGDKDWEDAKKQAKNKSKKLGMLFYIITNCKTSVFYNRNTEDEITLNSNPIREFQTIDILRLIKHRLKKNPLLNNIRTNVDSISTISEAIFNKKLWEVKNIYRDISFKNNQEKIDFTIGFIALEFFEEKEKITGVLDDTKIYWTDCKDTKAEKIVANISRYIQRLESETQFREFKKLMEIVRIAITGGAGKKPLVDSDDVKNLYNIVDSMKPLHGCGFDLFGAVYEMFAEKKEKKEFGEYFTRRHYAHVFSKLLLREENFFNKDKKFTIIDPACGTGGFLTEAFKVLRNKYESTKTYNSNAISFLENNCLYGIDVREDNISRTKLNMFLVGDGHTNMYVANTLKFDFENKYIDGTKRDEYKYNGDFDYLITNPPYGNGTIVAESDATKTTRKEIAFLCRAIKLLKIGGNACVVTPDGVLENPSFAKFRKELLEKCDINAIVSLPKFAFAPYTKEKTYALYFTKRSKEITKPQHTPIWMYIIDNDGLANSDKRFQTKLRNNRNGWLHDEISGWVSTEGEEMSGLLEERWLSYDDEKTNGTEWIDEKGNKINAKKAGFININQIINDKYCTLLPEYYLRPYEPTYIEFHELDSRIKNINQSLQSINLLDSSTMLSNIQNVELDEYGFLDLFEEVEKGNYGLTEEAIYASLQQIGNFIPIYGGNQEHHTTERFIPKKGRTKSGKKIKIFQGEGIILSLDGSAGCMTYKKNENFALNHHAGFIRVKENAKDIISPEFFSIFFESLLREASVSEGSKTLTLGQLYSMKFILPSYHAQKKVMEKIMPILEKMRKINNISKNIDDLLNKSIAP